MNLPVNYNETHYTKRKLVREEYIKLQEGKCCHCGQPLDGPPAKSVSELSVHRDLFPVGFFKNPHHLHHNHETGMTIGTVHAYCNAVLWEYHGE